MGFPKQQGESFQRNGRKPPQDPDAMDVDVAETQAEANGMFKKLLNEERKQLQAKGRCFRCKKQGHMSRDCPLKGKTTKKAVPFKRKARMTETGEESSEEEEEADVANMEDV